MSTRAWTASATSWPTAPAASTASGPLRASRRPDRASALSEPVELTAGGLTFTCRTAGRAGAPVVLLHGFPETSRMWDATMASLVEAGYQCLAPDQRGYSRAARPTDVEAYRYAELAADVHRLAAAAGFERFHLVGHDWGAIAGWAAVAADPGPIASFTALSVPHYHAFATAVRDDPEEELYRGILEMLVAPGGAAEAALGGSDLAGLRAAWSAHDASEVDDYAQVFSQPGALTAAIDWYRACRAHARALDDASFVFGPVAVPTLLLWGRNDPYIRRRSLDLAAPLMTGPYEVVELDAGHWLVQEQPQQVTAALLRHLAAHPI